MKYIPLLTTLVALHCSYVSSSDKETEIATRAILVAALTSPNSATTCDSSSPAFSTLKSAGFETSCGRSGCHDGTTRFNSTNYAQVKGLTNPGTANSSLLYLQIKGAMAIYSNASIDKAIYCWIQGGSNP